jgi:transcriptional regulator with XRE-family HTH domain
LPDFGACLRLLREAHGWTLRDLMTQADLGTTSSVALVEQGGQRLTPALQSRLAQAYRLPGALLERAAPATDATLVLRGHPVALAAVLAFARRAGVVDGVEVGPDLAALAQGVAEP